MNFIPNPITGSNLWNMMQRLIGTISPPVMR